MSERLYRIGAAGPEFTDVEDLASSLGRSSCSVACPALSGPDIIADVAREVSAFAETAKRLAEIGDGILGSPEAFGRFVGINVETDTAGGTLQLRVRLEVTETMLALLAALRAGNVQLGVIEQCLGHPNLSCVLQPGVDAESVAGETSPPTTPGGGT